MTEPLQVGQFAIVDHEPVDRGPNAGIFFGKGPHDDRAELYIVAEGTTPAGESFAGHIVSTAGATWQTLDMSLTGAIGRIFSDAASSLRDWNAKSIAQHRVSLGLSCVARRGTQVVIAQAGPAIAFHRHAGRPIEVVQPDDEHSTALGAGPGIAPQLTKITLAENDRVLLLSTTAANELDFELVEGILGLPTGQVLSNLFRRVQDVRHVTALFVAQAGEQAAPRALIQPGDEVIDATARPPRDSDVIGGELPPDAFQPSLFIDDRAEDAVDAARRSLVALSARPQQRAPLALPLAAEIPAPLRRASGENILARLADERRLRATLVEPMHGGTSRPAWRSVNMPTPARSEPALDVRRRHRKGTSFSRGLVPDETPPPPPIHTAIAAPVAEMAEDTLRGRPLLLSAVTETIATENSVSLHRGGALVHVRPNLPGRWKGGGALSRPTALSMEKLPPTWLIIALGLGVLMVVVGMIAIPRLFNGDDAARYAELVDQANQKLATAGALKQDPSERRRALTEAQGLLLEARDTDGAGPEATALLKDVSDALATMDAVRSPAAVEVIGSLEQFGDKPVAVTRLAVAEREAYLLENASAQVLVMTLASGEHKVVYSEDKEAKRGRPVAIVFVAGNDLGGPSLLIADSGRTLWAYSAAAGLRQVPFATAADLQITDITLFGRDLYVLDAAGNAVYRFSATDGGYGGGQRVLQTKDLANAQRLSVDREIVVADANGTLRRFAGQLSLTLSEAGIDKKLVAADTPQVMGKNGEIALLDSPNDRIVVFRSDGPFDRQYRHKDFKGLTAFTLANGGAYVFSEGKLRRVTW